MKNRLLYFGTFLMLCCLFSYPSRGATAEAQTPAPVLTQDDAATNLPSATNEIVIHASRERVWQAIIARRTSSVKRKELSHTNKQAMVQEEFPGCPILGDIKITYVEVETQPLQRMDYHMVESNQFKAFEGHYLLKNSPDDSATVLQLTSTVDPGIRIPFWRDIARGQANRDVKATLREIAQLAGDAK